jgi:Putative adhesin
MLTASKRALLLTPVIAIAFAALPARAGVREEFHKTVAMEANGNFSLQNVNGGITISAWDKNEVQIDAVKTAGSDEKLHAARIEVAGCGSSVDVQTRYPDQTNNNPANVEYTIHLPRGAHLLAVETVNGGIHIDGPRGRIKASSVNGKVEVWNAANEVELSSVNGEVHASLSNAGKSRVKLNVVNGSISIALPASTNARVKASTIHGGIHSDLPLQVEKSQYAPGANVDSTLGSGGATIELESVNGSIYLHQS